MVRFAMTAVIYIFIMYMHSVSINCKNIRVLSSEKQKTLPDKNGIAEVLNSSLYGVDEVTICARFKTYQFKILHTSNPTLFQFYTLPIFHSYNPTHFQSYTLPILHSSNPTHFQSYTLPIFLSSNLTLFLS